MEANFVPSWLGTAYPCPLAERYLPKKSQKSVAAAVSGFPVRLHSIGPRVFMALQQTFNDDDGI